MNKFNLRIPSDEHNKMVGIKEKTGVPIGLQLLLAWREKYGGFQK